jgi:sulfhydrogenase subunit beta (sulfur reductase)
MKLIKRKDLIKWLQHNVKTTNLVAPKDVGGVLLYRPVHDVKEIIWDYIRPALSSKEFLFPPTDRLLKIETQGQDIKITETIPNQEQVIFGIRPCDARGITALDALFIDSDPVDLNYAQRRQNTTIIGMACEELGDSCFCTSTGGAPDDPAGMDILLKRIDGGFAIQAVTEKGQRIVKDEWDTVEDNRPFPKSGGTITDSQYPIPQLDTWPPQFDDQYWEEMSERCLSCRICAYVCPTCRCFDVRDELVESDNGSDTYERLRCWDSCAGEVYRRIAGGHNPRSEKGQRLRNRFFCKFYYYPEKYDTVACTGCGRCIDSCPVNIDITEVLDHVKGLSTKVMR